MLAAAGEAQEGAEDHVLMVAHHLLEGEIGVQAGLDHKSAPKVSCWRVKLCKGGQV